MESEERLKDKKGQHSLLDAFGEKSSSSGRGRVCLYDILGVSTEASDHEIRKAYFKLAVLVHPDRNPEDSKATVRFQSLQKVYSVLSNEDTRRLYDETGCVEDEDGVLNQDACENLYQYYKQQFREVTKDAIDEFKGTYQNSEEEMCDVLSYYAEFEGDMAEVFGHVMLSDPEVDSNRFMDLIRSAIDDGRVEEYKKFVTWSKKVEKRKKKGGNVVKQGKKSKKDAGLEDLERAILARRGGSNGLQAFAEKWGCGEELEGNHVSEEAFELARQRLEEKGKRQKTK